MNRQTIIAALCALVILGGQSALAQSGYDLFQKGLVQERAKGDLNEAIRFYQQIVEDHKDDRALVAKALVQMGQCYEKLGRAEARKAYERVVQEFADQFEPVRVAREHLKQLDAGAPGTTGNGPTYSLLLDSQIAGLPVGYRDFSPSGDRVVFRSPGKPELYIADHTATAVRPLLEDLGPWRLVGWPTWSPDGRLISYCASRKVTSDSGTRRAFAIFVISPADGAPRQIGPEVKERILRAFWTPDSKHLSYWTRDSLHTVTLDGNQVRLIPRKKLRGVSKLDNNYSPNGRWLVCHRSKEKGSGADICILPATGGAIRRLTDLPGASRAAEWAPDGRAIYFMSGPGNATNIWRLPMDPEAGVAKGEPRQVTFFKDVLIVWPKMVGDGSRIRFHMHRQSTFIRVADASSPREALSLVRSGKYSPELSPDGQTVYYVNDTPGEEGIYSVSRRGGKPRRLTESLPSVGFDISPDGRTLAYSARFGEGLGLFTLPVGGGEPKLMVKLQTSELEVVPQWSPDDSSLAYADAKSLYIIDADGGKPRKLATLKGYLEEYTVRWSPDGKYVASLGSSDPNSNNAVFVMPASGGELRRLTPVTKWLEGLEWHPDGKRLTYHVSRGESETRQAYLDGRPPSLLLDAPGVSDYVGVWAPDGRRFFFEASGESEPGGMYVYDEVSGKTTLVDDSAGIDEAGVPSWSRDGKTMAWCATRATASQTWMMENFQSKPTADK